MSKLKFSVKLLDTNAVISQNIAQALLKDVEVYFNKLVSQMQSKIPEIVVQNIISQPEYSALLSGNLQYELGITNPSARLSEILDTIRSGAIINTQTPKVVSNKISAKAKLQMIQKDFSDLLSLGSASFTSEKGSEIDWLRWLLIEGDSVIISDYNFILGPSKASRTGMGIMRQSSGGSWRVPPEYAGSINNNWITRAIDSAVPQIDQLISNLIK